MNTASPDVDVGRGESDLLLEIDLHDRHEALLVRLLIDLDLNVAGLHLLDDLRREIEPAEQNLARRDAAILSMRATFECQKPGLEIGGRVRMGAEIGADAVGRRSRRRR